MRLPLLKAAVIALLCPLISGQEIQLSPEDGAFHFGNSVAISGNTVIVGAVDDNENGTESGSAYLFNAITGVQISKLLPDNGMSLDRFGTSVDIHGNTAVVGATKAENTVGSVYIFDTLSGNQLAEIGFGYDKTGTSVSIDGAKIIAGAPQDYYSNPGSPDPTPPWPGRALLFDITDLTNVDQMTLSASDGDDGDDFGMSVAISGNTVIVGAPNNNNENGGRAGAAYLFDATTGAQLSKLLAEDGSEGDWFGWSVAISGNTAIVGAVGDDDNGPLAGSAYLFDTTTGAQIEKISASTGLEGRFGRSVAINGNIAAVGALSYPANFPINGRAFLFDATTGAQVTSLWYSDAWEGDEFGCAVALNEYTAVVGAQGKHSAYIFAFDCDQNGLIDIEEIASGSGGDCNQDGVLDQCQTEGNDCNSDDIPDDCQLAANDCNQDGVPDECQTEGNDCNSDDIPDDCQLAANDCNQDGVPDECQTEGNDCNSDAIPDECQLTGNDCNEDTVPDDCQTSENDCDLDGVPDECEIDCNRNSIPDDCELDGNDCNLDSVPDDCQITDNDCNSDLIPDECQLNRNDLNDNLVPDECDPDCNQNGLPDFLDLAYEVSLDCNNNETPDECDIGSDDHNDCNLNGIPDSCDVNGYFSDDCNNNNVPDECEDDCNSNQIPDECDINEGTSLDINADGLPDDCAFDCNENGVPDYFDIQFNVSEDCDLNGIPDECDEDCNHNGVADACDIADGTEEDSNGNGIPDSCQSSNSDGGGGCGVMPVSGPPTFTDFFEHYAPLLLLLAAGRILQGRRRRAPIAC